MWLGLGMVVVLPSSWLAARLSAGNLGVIQPGQSYRSGQLSATALGGVIDRYRIKTVLNLRGPNPDARWHDAERLATVKHGASLVDVALSSCEWMSRDQARALLEILETAPRPLLVHCQWGSERTGLISAFLELLRPGSTLDDARRQFRIHYLYVPVGNGVVMARHLEQYESWLTSRGVDHTPDRFQAWLVSGFRPGTPCREQWEYDPYPLVVTTSRPTP